MATTMATSNRRPRRMVQNFHLVWLDANIDEVNNDDCRNSISKLKQIVNTIHTFIDADECIKFVDGIKEEKTFMITSGALGQTTVPMIHNKSQITTIYIFCGNKARHEVWTKEWPKIKGVFTDIKPICEALKKAAHDCDQNAVSISFVKATDGSSKENLDTLDSSFMYTQILKEILLTIDFDQSHINDFLRYCREEFADNKIELKNIDKIEKEYRQHPPIWWYTYHCFLYSMLNRALRLMEVDRIVKMGFFVRDLHNHIATLHAEQYGGHHQEKSLVVFRGQGLSTIDFEQLMKTKGGLLAFNNFLSTSKNRKVSLEFVRETMATSDMMGVLFIMKIDTSVSATPFANIKGVSYYQDEEEIVFSMHSVFRIDQVKQIDKNTRLWEVELTLTNDNDPQLHALAKHMQEETQGPTGWFRLGQLMVKLGQFDKAEELFEILLKQTNNDNERSHIFYYLGWTKSGQGKYEEAIALYEKGLEIKKQNLPADHSHLANYYSNIGLVYNKMGKYSIALSYYEKALAIQQKTLPPNLLDLAACYNNIGALYDDMKEYTKALSNYEKALEIKRKILPSNHPSLATSYNNLGLVYDNLGEYSKALLYYEQDLSISQKILPVNHPDLATPYNNIASVYNSMRDYSKALLYYDKALEIWQKSLTENHPILGTSYSNIGLVYENMREHSKAVSYYERALDIKRHSLSANHPTIKNLRERIEIVKKKL